MAWLDDLARWATRPEEERGGGTGLLERRVSRRGALGLFGGTATALVVGTLGDPPAAEAIERCCDPNNNGTWSCPDGHPCCCYLVAGGGGHSECCDPAQNQTCQSLPGQIDRGTQVVACCATVCANDCCTTPDQFCDSNGYCMSCGDLERCGDNCCDVGHHCEQGVCMIDCPQGQDSCIDTCCSTTEDCVEEVCLEKCKPNAMRCGADHACCEPGETCQDGKCSGCALPTISCGAVCCDEGKYCDDVNGTPTCTDCPSGTSQCGDTCCPDTTTCQVFGTRGVCTCASGTFCVDHCCAPGEHCTPSGCAPCPSPDATGCGPACCEPPFVCTIDHCDCEHGGICGGTCCATGEECVAGVCKPACQIGEARCGEACCPSGQTCVNGQCQVCAAGTTVCGNTCCPAPMECYAPDRCRCPAGQISCETGCCPETPAAQAKVKSTVTVEHGSAAITVTCTGGCSGTVTLQTAGAATASLLAIVAGKHGPMLLGTAHFKVPAGRKSKTVKVPISHAGKRYLAKHKGHVKAKALVKTTGHTKSWLTRAFTLRSAKPKR
jgi:hypothetical protein